MTLRLLTQNPRWLVQAIFLGALSVLAATSVRAASSLTQFGITWTFDRNYPTGQFANGDYWVVGPVTITKITPCDTNLSDSTDIDGSVVNPGPDLSAPYVQGWDSRIANTTYDRSLNVARRLPLQLAPGSSLVSTVSYATPGDLYLSDAAVLTVLSSAPGAGSFRPPYAGTDKTVLGTVDDLNLTIFRNLAPVANTPALSSFDYQFNEPMIDIVGQWVNSILKNANAGPNYGRDIATAVGTAVLSLNLNYTNAQKLPLVIKLVQRGIDTYGLAKAGMVWFPNGGHNTGRKLPMLIAAKALGRADMLAWADAGKHFIFQEDMQHFVIAMSDVTTPRSSSTMSPYTTAMVGQPEWASNPVTERNQTGSEWGKAYRIVNGVADTGLALSANLMGLRDEWNYEPMFNYVDQRFWPTEGPKATSSQTIPVFHRNMWTAYRNSAPSQIEVDNTSTAGLWQNASFGTQSGAFTCSFDMVPSAAGIDGLTGLSRGAAGAVSDLAVALRFTTAGKIDASNGSAYQAAASLSYSAGVTYHVALTVDLAAHRYSAVVTPKGASAVTIAKDYAFRTAQAAVASLGNVGFMTSSGAHSVYNVAAVATSTSTSSTGGSTTVTPPADPTPVTTTSALVNGSFESGTDGWSTYGNYTATTATAMYPSTEGSHLIAFNGGNSACNGSIAQTVATTVGRSYTISLDMGVMAYNKNTQKLQFDATGSGALLSQTTSLNGIGSGKTVWKHLTFTFVANSSATKLKFTDVSTTTNSIDLLLDNVVLTAAASATGTSTSSSTGTSTSTAAVVTTLTNGSFESGTNGWSTWGNFAATSASTMYPCSDGTRLIVFNGGNTASSGSIAQTIATTVGKRYTVSFDMGVMAYNRNAQAVQFDAVGSATALSQTTTLNGVGSGKTVWKHVSLSFVANSTSTKLKFTDVSTTTNSIDLLLDNVQLSQ